MALIVGVRLVVGGQIVDVVAGEEGSPMPPWPWSVNLHSPPLCRELHGRCLRLLCGVDQEGIGAAVVGGGGESLIERSTAVMLRLAR